MIGLSLDQPSAACYRYLLTMRPNSGRNTIEHCSSCVRASWFGSGSSHLGLSNHNSSPAPVTKVLWPCLHYAVLDAPKIKLCYKSASFKRYTNVLQRSSSQTTTNATLTIPLSLVPVSQFGRTTTMSSPSPRSPVLIPSSPTPTLASSSTSPSPLPRSSDASPYTGPTTSRSPRALHCRQTA